MIEVNKESDKIINMIKTEGGNTSDSKVILDAIKEDKKTSVDLYKLWKEYLGDVSIKDRKPEKINDVDKPNAKLQTPFRRTIVDSKNDVYLSNGVIISYDTTKYTAAEQTLIDNTLNEFKTRNDFDDLNYELGQLVSACGYAYRLTYINENGDETIYNLNPWETHIEFDPSTNKSIFAFTYYLKKRVLSNSKTVFRYYVEYYDTTTRKEYMQSDDGTELLLQDEKPHMFKGVPIIKVINPLEKSEFEDVGPSIDDYDERVSDTSNDLNGKNTKLVIKTGAGIKKVVEFVDSDTLKIGKEDSVEWISRNVPVEAKEAHLNRLKADIFQSTATVDFYDTALESGVARQLRLYNMLNKIKAKEKKFEKGLKEMFRLLLTPWNIKGIPLKLQDMDFQFCENLPDFTTVDDAIKAVTADLMSRKTGMEKIGIEDANAEMDEIQNEKEQYGGISGDVNLDNLDTGQTQ